MLGFTLTEQAKLGLVIQASKDLFFTKEDLCDKMLILLIGVGEREGWKPDLQYLGHTKWVGISLLNGFLDKSLRVKQ